MAMAEFDEPAQHPNVRLLLALADDIEDGRQPSCAGLLRQIARDFAEGTVQRSPDECPRCGEPIVQPASGRRRQWCSAACRKAAASKRRRNASMAS